MLVPLAAVAYWVVPLVYGVSYRGAVPLLWILALGPTLWGAARSLVAICQRQKPADLWWHGRKGSRLFSRLSALCLAARRRCGRRSIGLDVRLRGSAGGDAAPPVAVVSEKTMVAKR